MTSCRVILAIGFAFLLISGIEGAPAPSAEGAAEAVRGGPDADAAAIAKAAATAAAEAVAKALAKALAEAAAKAEAIAAGCPEGEHCAAGEVWMPEI